MTIERAFGESPWTVGVEEELVLVNEETLDVASASALLERGVDGAKRELFACMVETTTGVCATAADALAKLVALRRAVADAAASDGLRVLATGSHPFALPEAQQIVDVPHYLEFVELAGPAARRQLVCGLHVHVGMPDAETCVHAHEAVVPWLPLVLALSANSPWFRGEPAGLMSKRAEVLATLPRAGVPPRWDGYGAWEQTMERFGAAGVGRPENTWWDARVHPAMGTLELRAPDQPTEPALAGAFVALLHALALFAAREQAPPASRPDVHTNRFLASRFGPAAELLHPEEDRLVPVPELYRELLDRLGPTIEELGVTRLLEPLDPERCEAELQLAAGDARAAADDLVRRSLASPA